MQLEGTYHQVIATKFQSSPRITGFGLSVCNSWLLIEAEYAIDWWGAHICQWAYCNVCTPQTEMTLRNPEAGSAYWLSPQSLASKEARIKLWGITTHIQAKGNKFPWKLVYIQCEKITWSVAVHSIMDLKKVCMQSVGCLCAVAVHSSWHIYWGLKHFKHIVEPPSQGFLVFSLNSFLPPMVQWCQASRSRKLEVKPNRSRENTARTAVAYARGIMWCAC